MRRMLTNKNVVDVVNKAIDDGEIEVSGSLPEIQEGDAGKALVVNEQEDGVEWAEVGAPDNVLVLPDVAPVENELVIIDQDGEQNSLTVGDGLEIANGQLMAPYEILTIDCNAKTLANQANSLSISNALAEKIKLSTTLVRLINVSTNDSNSQKVFGMLFSHSTTNLPNKLYNISLGGSTDYATVTTNGTKYQCSKRATLTINGTEDNYYLTLFYDTTVGIVTRIYNPYSDDMSIFSDLSGTKTMPANFKEVSSSKTYSHVLFNSGSAYVRLFIKYISSSSPYLLVAVGEDDTYKYVLNWYGAASDGHTAGEYTITQTAI